MAGRPSKHSKALEERVLAALSEQSMVNVCKRKDMPSRQTIYKWMDTIDGFADKYARACRERADHRAELIDDIAQATLNGDYDPQAARVAIDAHKWTTSKLAGDKYGERHKVEHSGSLGLHSMSDEELDRMIAERQHALEQSQ